MYYVNLKYLWDMILLHCIVNNNGLTSSLPLPPDHMHKLSVTTSTFFSIRAISYRNNLLRANFEWFKRNEFDKFFCEQVTDIKIWLLYYLSLLTTDTVFPSTNKLFTSTVSVLLTGVPATWLWWLKLPMGQAMSRHLKHVMGGMFM